MNWNVVKFLNDYRIQFRQKSANWVNICCPFKHNHKGGDIDFFGGFDLSTGGYNCWSCGGLHTHEVVEELLSVSEQEAKGLVQGYGGSDRTKFFKERRKNASMLQIPGKREPRERHINYLKDRGYDPEFMDNKYQFYYTTGKDPGWEHKIILPITYGHRVVSYQGRDVTGSENVDRYRSATPEESLVHYKDIIFGLDNWDKDVCGIVEGAFDVYRMGKGIGTGFGSALTDAQIYLLANRFRRVVFLFDPTDERAWAKAGNHVAEFRSMGVSAERIKWEGGDPDELGFVECRLLKNEVGIK